MTPQLYGTAATFADWTAAAPTTTRRHGCRTCTLATVTAGGTVIDRYKETRTKVPLVPYCPACYSYPMQKPQP